MSSQPALMTGGTGLGSWLTGGPSMGGGGSSGVRRLPGRAELRLLVCHPPLRGDERECGGRETERLGRAREDLRGGGHSLGDALIGVVVLVFIPRIVPGQFLPLAQQTGHTHGPWDLARWALLLPPQTRSVSGSPSRPRSHPAPPEGLPHPRCLLCPGPPLLLPHSPFASRLQRDPGRRGHMDRENQGRHGPRAETKSER